MQAVTLEQRLCFSALRHAAISWQSRREMCPQVGLFGGCDTGDSPSTAATVPREGSLLPPTEKYPKVKVLSTT
jgi:hypothetical protein